MPLSGNEWRELRQRIRMLCYRVAIELRSDHPDLGSICPEPLPSNTQIAKEKCHLILSNSPEWHSDSPLGKASATYDWKHNPKRFVLYDLILEIYKHGIDVSIAWNAVYIGYKAGCFLLTVPEGSELSDGMKCAPETGRENGGAFRTCTHALAECVSLHWPPNSAGVKYPSDE